MTLSIALFFLLGGCDAPCETYTEDEFWTDLDVASCRYVTRCGLGDSCPDEYHAYMRGELRECGATFVPCAAKELIRALEEDSCESQPGTPRLSGEVYTPECPGDTAR